jgi:hypothetical protein
MPAADSFIVDESESCIVAAWLRTDRGSDLSTRSFERFDSSVFARHERHERSVMAKAVTC